MHEGTGAAAVSNDEGAYRTDALAPGPYRLETVLEGFDTAVRRIVLDLGQPPTIEVTLVPSQITEAVVVTARRIEEAAQEVPIAVSVVSGHRIDDGASFNVNRLKELVPTVQFYSTNPRNSAINIRGLGAPFGAHQRRHRAGCRSLHRRRLLLIDGVFYSRPASATLDFLDVERVEVLRGPQGTLFGKNTSAGAINVTTRKPTFTPESDLELNYGSDGFLGLGSLERSRLPRRARDHRVGRAVAAAAMDAGDPLRR